MRRSVGKFALIIGCVVAPAAVHAQVPWRQVYKDSDLTVIFDTASVEQSEKAYAACRRAVRAAAKEGYGEYRAHLDFMDLAADQYSFNDHAYRRFTETIKDALDPNGILSPGKQGIWPRAMRNGARPGS